MQTKIIDLREKIKEVPGYLLEEFISEFDN